MRRQFFGIATNDFQRGQVALFTVVIFILISLVVLGGFGIVSTAQLRDARELSRAKQAFAWAESGVEDMTLRTLSGTMEYSPTETIYFDGGSATTQLTLDGYIAQGANEYPKFFEMVSVGDSENRFRKIKMNFMIPDERLSVGITSAIQAGHVGVLLQGQTPQIIGTSGYGKGDVFSNGSIVSDAGNPLINGNATVARHLEDEQQQHNNAVTDAQIVACGSACWRAIGTDPHAAAPNAQRHAAQAFIPNTTAKIRWVDIVIKEMDVAADPTPVADPTVSIIRNERVKLASGYPTCLPTDELSATPPGVGCMDMPSDNSDRTVISKTFSVPYTGGISGNPTSGTFAFQRIDFTTVSTYNASAPLAMNEKYWIVIESGCTGSAVCFRGDRGYYLIAGLDGTYDWGRDKDNNLNANFGGVNNPFPEAHCATCPPGDTAKLYLVNNLIDPPFQASPPPAGLPSTSIAAFDIAFRIYLGEPITKISGFPMRDHTNENPGTTQAAGDQLEIIGNALAEYLEAVDVGGIAYFENVPTTNVIDGPQTEVKAGADYIINSGNISNPTSFMQTAHANTLSDPNQHPNSIDQHGDLPIPPTGNICPTSQPAAGVPPAPSQLGPAFAPNKAYNTVNDAWGCRQPFYSTDSRRHCWNSYCSCSINGEKLGAFCKKAGSTPPAGAPEIPSIPLPLEPFGFNGQAMSFEVFANLREQALSLSQGQAAFNGNLTLNSPTGAPAYGSIPGTLDRTMFPPSLPSGITCPGGVTCPFPYAVINGNLSLGVRAKLKLVGLNSSGVCPWDGTSVPCFVLWVKGDLTMTGSSELYIETPPGAPADFEASFYVVVDGRVVIQDAARVYNNIPSPTGRNAATIVSYYPGLGIDNTAIKLTSSSGGKGSVFYAYRGGVLVQQEFEAKAIAAQQIIVDGSLATIKFDEGLKTPSSHRGGTQKTGADITAYYESQ